MTLEEFYKRLKEHGLIGYNWPGDDTVKISRKAAGSAAIEFSKDATSWEEVSINWAEFHAVLYPSEEVTLQLVSEYLQDNKPLPKSDRYCLVNPTPYYRYITDINFVCGCTGQQDAEVHFAIKANQEPRWFSAGELEALKKRYPILVPLINAMKVKE